MGNDQENERSTNKLKSDVVLSSKQVNNPNHASSVVNKLDNCVGDPKVSDSHRNKTMSTESTSSMTPLSQIVNSDGVIRGKNRHFYINKSQCNNSMYGLNMVDSKLNLYCLIFHR